MSIPQKRDSVPCSVNIPVCRCVRLCLIVGVVAAEGVGGSVGVVVVVVVVATVANCRVDTRVRGREIKVTVLRPLILDGINYNKKWQQV